MSIRPSVAGPDVESEPSFSLNFEGFKDIWLERKVLVIADQPRISRDCHRADVALAANQHAKSASVLARYLAVINEIDAERVLWKPLCTGWQLAGRGACAQHFGLDKFSRGICRA